ncbi:MAG TPA: hypothetical protein PLD62_07090 [Candidatus Cloacimonadota bacterium]|nr:hypothetical protein [Candidatus Cloacimonadota bacterium]
MKKFYILSLLVLFVMSALVAKDLDDTLESLSGDAAKSYVKPIVSAFGTNLNGGWFHWSPAKKFLGLDVEFGLVAMGTVFPDDDKDFNATGTFQFTTEQADQILANSDIQSGDPGYDELVEAIISQEMEINIHGATIIGDSDDHVMIEYPQQDLIVDVNGTNMTFPISPYSLDSGIGGLLDGLTMLPMAAPQLSIGTFYGTKAAFRYVPTMKLTKDLGNLDYFGFGIQHNPKAWLMIPLPVDFCFSYFMQTMNLGDYITANASTFGLNVSKTFGMKFLSITPYAGYMLESSNMEFKYSYEVGEVNGVALDPVKVKFDIDGKNTNRLTLGTTFRLGVFNFNADYNIGKYNSFTAGFALGI